MKAPTETWEKNLYALVVSEFLVIAGFYSASLFLPLFIHQLGDFSEGEAAFWAGLATGAPGLAAFIAMPIWGMMADRYGRKPMVLRAQLGGAAVVMLLGLSPNVHFLIGLRLVQGLLTGTVGAISAMVAAQTPRDRMPFAMGLLMLSVYAGSTIGPVMGGALANSLGFRPAFFVIAGLMFIGGLVVLFFTTEKFEKVEQKPSASIGGLVALLRSRELVTILVVLMALQVGVQALTPVIPLLLKVLGTGNQAAMASGVTFGLMGALAATSSLVSGRLASRFSMTRILFISCLGTAALYLLPMLANSVTQLVIFTALTSLFLGGMMTTANALVGVKVSRSSQGVAYGVAQSAGALGGGLGPLLGGMVASLAGFKAVFPIASAIFLAVALLVSRMPEPGKTEKP